VAPRLSLRLSPPPRPRATTAHCYCSLAPPRKTSATHCLLTAHNSLLTTSHCSRSFGGETGADCPEPPAQPSFLKPSVSMRTLVQETCKCSGHCGTSGRLPPRTPLLRHRARWSQWCRLPLLLHHWSRRGWQSQWRRLPLLHHWSRRGPRTRLAQSWRRQRGGALHRRWPHRSGGLAEGVTGGRFKAE